MWGLPQKQNARRADKIRLCGHLRRYKKIVKKIYIIYIEILVLFLYFKSSIKVFILWMNTTKSIEKQKIYRFSTGNYLKQNQRLDNLVVLLKESFLFFI